MKKVALFLAEGFEEIEAVGTIDILRRGGLDVKTISITDEKDIVGAHQIVVKADDTFDKTDISQFDAIVLPGGMPGAANLNGHEGLKNQILEFAKQQKLVAAICAAPMVLGGLDLLKGKNATAYPGFEQQLIGANVTGASVAVDGSIITGRGPGLVFEFALQIVQHLAGEERRNEVAAGMLLQ